MDTSAADALALDDAPESEPSGLATVSDLGKEPATPPFVCGRLELPDGGWAEIRDPKVVRQKDRKAVMATMDEATQAGVGNLMKAMGTADKIMCLAIESWSYSLTPPGMTEEEKAGASTLAVPSADPRVLDELPIPVYDALSEGCKEFSGALFPDFSASAADNENRVGPTGPSGG